MKMKRTVNANTKHIFFYGRNSKIYLWTCEHRYTRHSMPRKKGRPKKYEEGFEKAQRFGEIRLGKKEEYISERFIRMAEEEGQSIPDFLKKTVFPDFLSRHFKDMKLTDFERIFSELEIVPLDRSLELKSEKEIFLIEFNLKPVFPLRYIFEADSLFFKLMKLDLSILYETWGNFLYENKILDYGLKIPEINQDFIKKFNEFGEICLDFLLKYQRQLTDLIFFSDLFKDDLKKPIVDDVKEFLKDEECFKDEETKKRTIEILDLNSEITYEDSINSYHPSQIKNQEKGPILPIIRLQKTEETGFNWGSVEIKNLEYAYKEKAAHCLFFGSCNLWRSFIRSISDLNTLVLKHGDVCEYISKKFYRGLKRFTKKYADRIANELILGINIAEYDDYKKFLAYSGDFLNHFEEYGEKKILSYTEKNEEE